MSVRSSFTFLGLVLLFFQCKTSLSSAEENKDLRTLYVAAQRVDCTGVGPQTCYQVRLTPQESWNLYYGEIEGFDYEAGYEYKIKVEKIFNTNPPADAAGFRYQLVEVLDKKAPEWIGLHDIWVLESIEGTPVTVAERPRLELFPGEERIQGFAGCNQFFGKMKASAQSIQFSGIGSTKMFCTGKMEMESQLLSNLAKADTYLIKNLQLILLKGKQQLMVLRKVD